MYAELPLGLKAFPVSPSSIDWSWRYMYTHIYKYD